jgi:hypothetical protein
MIDTIARLEALASDPKPWLVTTTYQCGKVRMLRQPREAMARNYAAREAGKVGRELIDRETGQLVRIVAVDVDYLPETI